MKKNKTKKHHYYFIGQDKCIYEKKIRKINENDEIKTGKIKNNLFYDLGALCFPVKPHAVGGLVHVAIDTFLHTKLLYAFLWWFLLAWGTCIFLSFLSSKSFRYTSLMSFMSEQVYNNIKFRFILFIMYSSDDRI